MLDPFLRHPGRSGILLDFDGTLAPIVAAFDRAEPSEGTPARLASLAARYARVAVISGRPVAYLTHRLAGCGATELVGLYGLERVKHGRVTEAPGASEWRSALAAAADDAEREAPSGVRVERKGLAVTVHYRSAPNHEGWVRRWVKARGSSSGLAVHPAKMSMELRPPVPTDKGSVAAELAAGLSCVCYIGDDVGDLPAYAALQRLRAGGSDTLAVAVASAETPQELLDAADMTVEGTAGVGELLAELDGRVPV